MKHIAILGLGQIGGSIVLTLRKKQKPYRIIGIDSSAKRLRLLTNALDKTSRQWTDAREADFVIVCLHYELTKTFLLQMSRDRLVMDVCSGKAKLVQHANSRKLRFIGGHPMTGNEFAREKGWRHDLFEQAPFFLCPSSLSTKKDVTIARSLVRDLGARPIIVDPQQHDASVAMTSHFPAILSKLLGNMSEGVPAHFKGPGFRSMTRLAKTSPELIQTFLQSNKEEILRSAKSMQKLLNEWILAAKTGIKP